MTEEVQKTPEKPKKSKWLLWTCGSCGCLVILIVIVLFALRSFTDFNFSNIFNGQKSSKSTDQEDVEMTKAELVNYFVDLTTNWNHGEMKIKLLKWDKPVVTISPADEPTPNGLKVIDDFIVMFNRNSTTTKLQRVDTGGDIKVYFQPVGSEVAGRAGPSSGADYIIDQGYIKFGDNVALFEQSESQVFAHELMHNLGFAGHYSGSTCRLLSPTTCGSHVTKNEERLIQMLYGTNIPAGIDETEIRNYFQNWSPK